jgi:hypothetical protein
MARLGWALNVSLNNIRKNAQRALPPNASDQKVQQKVRNRLEIVWLTQNAVKVFVG